MEGYLLEFELKHAVEEGELSEQDARKKLEDFRRKLKQKLKANDGERRLEIEAKLKEAGKKMRVAVEEGKVSAEEARERFEEYKKRLIEEIGKRQQKHRRNGEGEHEHIDDDLREVDKGDG